MGLTRARSARPNGVVHAKARKAEERLQQGLLPVDSFEAVAREWFEVKRGGWAKGHADKIIARLEADVLPYVGGATVAGVTGSISGGTAACRGSRSDRDGASRSGELRSGLSLRRGHGTECDLKDALRRPEPKHFPAITDPKRFGELLRACDAYAATPVVRAALKLAPMLLLRPGGTAFHRVARD